LHEFKGAIRDAAQEAVRQEWAARIRMIHATLDERVSEGFADLQRDIDEWFSEVQHWVALRFGGAAKAEDKDGVARAEILEMLRQTERLPA
jgi:hypothetical protein